MDELVCLPEGTWKAVNDSMCTTTVGYTTGPKAIGNFIL